MVPRLRFPEFRDAGEWEEKRLGQICFSVRSDLSASELTDDGSYDVYGASGIAGKHKYYQEESAYVAVVKDGSGAGRIFLCKPKTSVLSTLEKIKPSGDIDLKFLYAILQTINLKAYSIGGAIPHVYFADYANARISVPEKQEQQKIANILLSIDKLIDLHTKKVELLKEQKKGLMQRLFPREGERVPRLRFPEFRDAGEWEVKKLGEICEVLDNQRKPVAADKRKKGPYPYYGASGVIDYIDNYLFEGRMILIGEDGAKWGAFEKTAFIAEGKFWVNNHAHVLRAVDVVDVLIEKYLTMIDISLYVTGKAPPKLTLNNLKDIKIPIPIKKQEQQKIADFLSYLDELVELHTKKVELLKEQKKGLMQRLFPREGDA